ncbi:uncharacterized protein LOC119089881 [Pollicipes pollicipes]|uniref:uncharacterized protein LOC119089881 n=1 Tax=Pollicipes pollicipes TaxID=41117 RepID=UPI00188546C4|nr:uncharacterized protein LOC119089881 [Pollicipes pollicipes]
MAAGPLLLAATLAVLTAPAASDAYRKVYLDDPSSCNRTIRLQAGMSAALVRLSPTQLFRPLTCYVRIEVGDAGIAGLTAAIQELSIGKFDDTSNCTSYLQVSTFDRSHRYRERLCGEWHPSVHHLEVRRSLFGACDPSLASKHGHDCAARRIDLLAHVPGGGIDLVAWPPAFTVVVTAYFNEQLFGGCGSGRFLCVNGEPVGQRERCISQSLVCDGHPNCGFINNEDEYSTTCGVRPGPISESDHFFATWAGFAVIVLLLVVAVSYFIRSVRWTTGREAAEPGGRARPAREPAPPRPGAPEPPPYEALYPHGPPAGLLEKKRERAGEEAPRPPGSAARRPPVEDHCGA